MKYRKTVFTAISVILWIGIWFAAARLADKEIFSPVRQP